MRAGRLAHMAAKGKKQRTLVNTKNFIVGEFPNVTVQKWSFGDPVVIVIIFLPSTGTLPSDFSVLGPSAAAHGDNNFLVSIALTMARFFPQRLPEKSERHEGSLKGLGRFCVLSGLSTGLLNLSDHSDLSAISMHPCTAERS